MRILCCVDGTNIKQISRVISTLLSAETKTVGILYVTDTEPQERMEQQRERLLRPPQIPLSVREQMRQAEEAVAQEILEEGSRYFGKAEILSRVGRPDQEIVHIAEEWRADVIVIGSSQHRKGMPLRPKSGPKSIGHVARFVLDHATCPVLLIRPFFDKALPIARSYVTRQSPSDAMMA